MAVPIYIPTNSFFVGKKVFLHILTNINICGIFDNKSILTDVKGYFLLFDLHFSY